MHLHRSHGLDEFIRRNHNPRGWNDRQQTHINPTKQAFASNLLINGEQRRAGCGDVGLHHRQLLVRLDHIKWMRHNRR